MIDLPYTVNYSNLLKLDMGDEYLYGNTNPDTPINIEVGKSYDITITVLGQDYTETAEAEESTQYGKPTLRLHTSWYEYGEDVPDFLFNDRLQFELCNNIHLDLTTGQVVDDGYLLDFSLYKSRPQDIEEFESDFEKVIISEHAE